MRVVSTAGCFILFALLIVPAEAQEEGAGAATPEQIAEKVLTAYRGKNVSTLKSLAGNGDPDPWLVAADLLCRGEQDAAMAFAEAVPGAESEPLLAGVRQARGVPGLDTVGKRLAEAERAFGAKQTEEALRVLEGLEVPACRMLEVRLRTMRGKAYLDLRRLEEGGGEYLAAARVAGELGWGRHQAKAFNGAAMCCVYRGTWGDAQRLWERCLEMQKARGDLAGTIKTLGCLGNVQQAVGNPAGAIEFQKRALAVAKEIEDHSSAAWILGNLGVTYHGMGKLEEARASLEAGLAIAEEIADEHQIAAISANLGAILCLVKDYAGARECLVRGLRIAVDRGDRRLEAKNLSNLGAACDYLGRYTEAVEHQNRSLELQREVRDGEGIAISLSNLGRAHEILGNWEKALRCFEEGAEVEESRGNHDGTCRMQCGVGRMHARRGDRARALACMQAAREAAEAGKNGELQAAVLGQFGLVHLEFKEYAAARDRFREALTRNRELGRSAGMALSLSNLGAMHAELGDQAAALTCQEEALEIAESLGLRDQMAQALGNIGVCYIALGELAKAETSLERAVELRMLGPNLWSTAIACENLGNAYSARGRHGKAALSYERALTICEDLGNRRLSARLLGNIGNLYIRLGMYERALEFLDRAVGIARGRDGDTVPTRILLSLGVARYYLGRLEEAVTAYRTVLEQSRAEADRDTEATVLLNMAVVKRGLGKPEEALVILERALELNQAAGDRWSTQKVLLNLGECLEDLGKTTAAKDRYRACGELAREIGAVEVTIGVLVRQASLHLRDGSPGDALVAVRRAADLLPLLHEGLAELEVAESRERWDWLYGVGLDAALASGDLEEVVAMLEGRRAWALLSALGGRQKLREVTVSESLRRKELAARGAEAGARALYAEAVRGGRRRDVAKRKKELDRATRKVQEAVERIQREEKAAAELLYPSPLSLSEMQAALAKGEALLLYGFTETTAVAVVIERESARLVQLGESTKVRDACRALDGKNIDADPGPAILRLRELLIRPLGLGKDVRSLLVSPTGVLASLPFTLLASSLDVAFVPSGSVHGLLIGQRNHRGSKVLALGDPVYTDAAAGEVAHLRGGLGLAPLPATKEEARSVGDRVLLGAEASETRLRETLSTGSRWRAVHLACHCLVYPARPMLSSLALTADAVNDGFLTTLDVFRLQVPADLVVLSACETARGKVYRAEGIMGLTRAFMMAGAPRVICSLWQVDDEATKVLMVKFYELWNPEKGEGLSAAAALRQSQEFVKSHEKWKHPYYWAAWVLWGLPD